MREQHDALEFFNSLVDSLDEALKMLEQPSILSQIMGGSFADQKICKDCPHRFVTEEKYFHLSRRLCSLLNLKVTRKLLDAKQNVILLYLNEAFELKSAIYVN